MALSRLDSDVLVQEFLCSEIVHEVLRSHETALFIGVLEQDLIQALNDRLHHLLETELHGSILFLES